MDRSRLDNAENFHNINFSIQSIIFIIIIVHNPIYVLKIIHRSRLRKAINNKNINMLIFWQVYPPQPQRGSSLWLLQPQQKQHR